MTNGKHVFALSVALFGCGPGGNGGRQDLGGSSTPDLSAATDAAPATDDQGPPTTDLFAMAAGTKLPATSAPFSLVGITTDNLIIYTDSAGALKAIPLGGGKEILINAKSDDSIVDGKVVFSWSGLDPTTFVGKLRVWTMAGGAKDITATSVARVEAASSDGTYILYTDKPSSDASTADLLVAHSDGSAAKTVAMQRGMPASGCSPNLVFAGNKGVAGLCAAPGDAGAGAGTISSVDPASGMMTQLLADAQLNFSTDKAGTKVFAVAANGDAWVLPVSGGMGVKIDGPVAYGFFISDGSAVVYRTLALALKRAPSTGGSPVTLVAGKVASIVDNSPDTRWLLYKTQTDNTTHASDLYLLSTSGPSTPLTLVATPTGATFAISFTEDSSRVLFFTDLVGSGSSVVGTLRSQPVAGGAATLVRAKVYDVISQKGTRIIFADNYAAAPMASMSDHVDLWSVDVATMPPAPSLLATQADTVFGIPDSKDKLVYTYSATPATQGLYVATLP